jgi:hypothetical protein
MGAKKRCLLPVENRMPTIFKNREPAEVPAGIIGSRIIAFGTTPGSETEGGGLVIDYMAAGEVMARRATLGFNELGMWIESIMDFRED